LPAQKGRLFDVYPSRDGMVLWLKTEQGCLKACHFGKLSAQPEPVEACAERCRSGEVSMENSRVRSRIDHRLIVTTQHDLHPRFEPGWTWRLQSRRPPVTVMCWRDILRADIGIDCELHPFPANALE
jgi:hypothetical protein